MAMVKVLARPMTIPSGRLRPPSALADSSAGSTGRTQGVIAVPAPAMSANSISRSIFASGYLVAVAWQRLSRRSRTSSATAG